MNSFYNLLSQVNYNSNFVLLLNGGKAVPHFQDGSWVIEHETMGISISFEDITSVKWLNETVLCVFECSEGTFEVELLVKHYFQERNFA